MSAAVEEGKGIPAKLVVDHKCTNIDVETGKIRFENGVEATHDLIIGADGIGVSFHDESTPPKLLTNLTVGRAWNPRHSTRQETVRMYLRKMYHPLTLSNLQIYLNLLPLHHPNGPCAQARA